MIVKLRSDTLASRVAAQLFEAIIHGDFRPGDRIVEEKLAQQLGVAKTTLREALQNLEHQGLITKYAHRGSFVTKLTPRDIEEAYEVRLQLEPYAASLAHQRMNSEHYSQLEALLREIRNAGDGGDFVEVSKKDAVFHQLIWRQSANRVLERELRVICFPLWAFELIRLYAARTYDFETAFQEHRLLLDVLRKGGPENVRQTFCKTLKLFRDQDLRNLRALEDRPLRQSGGATASGSAVEVWQSFQGVKQPAN